MTSSKFPQVRRTLGSYGLGNIEDKRVGFGGGRGFFVANVAKQRPACVWNCMELHVSSFSTILLTTFFLAFGFSPK